MDTYASMLQQMKTDVRKEHIIVFTLGDGAVRLPLTELLAHDRAGILGFEGRSTFLFHQYGPTRALQRS